MKMTRKTVCVLLAVVLALGSFSFVSAEPQGSGVLHYVSLGDSAVTGYALKSYNDNPEAVETYGFNVRVEGACPDLVAKKLTTAVRDVDLAQLAVSGARVYELRMFLDSDFPQDDAFDIMFKKAFLNPVAKSLVDDDDEYAAMTDMEKVQVVGEYYRDKISKADLISLEIGHNSINEVVTLALKGNASFNLDQFLSDLGQGNSASALRARVVASLKKCLTAKEFTALNSEASVLMGLLDAIVYAYVDATINFDGCVERIFELNPDVELVVLPFTDALDARVTVKIADNLEIPLGKISQILANLVTEYQTNLSAYADRFKYADCIHQYPVTSQLDELVSGASAADLSEDTKYSVLWVLQDICDDLNSVATLTDLTVASGTDFMGNLDFLNKVVETGNLNYKQINPIRKGTTVVNNMSVAYQTGIVSASTFMIPTLAVDVADFLINGKLSGESAASRLDAVYGYINYNLIGGADLFACHPNRAGHEARANAIVAAYNSRLSSREAKIVEHYADYKEWVVENQEQREELRETVKTTAHNIYGVVKEVAASAMSDIKKVAEEAAVKAFIKVNEWFKSLF